VQSAKTTPQVAQPEVTAKTFYPQITQIGADFFRESRCSAALISIRIVPPLGLF